MVQRSFPFSEVSGRMRAFSILPLLALLLLPVGKAAALPDLVRTLPNKVTVVVREIRTRPLVSIQAWVRAGSRDETPKDRGLAVATTQCIMEATSRRAPGEMQKDVYALAGVFTSEAGYDYSSFDLTLPARSLGAGLNLLAEGLAQPRLDAPVLTLALDRAKRISRSVLFDADRAAVNTVRARLHEGTPLVSPLAVHEHEFSAVTPTLIQRFYRDTYVAENLIVVVTGDVDPEEAVQKVEAAFQSMPRGKAASRSRFNERAFEGPRVVLERNLHGTNGAAVTLGFRAPVWGSSDALALDLLLAVLVDSPISRAQMRLNAGNAEFIRASTIREYETDGGTVTLSFAADPDSLEDAEGALLALVEQARSTPIGQEEFQAAVNTVLQRDLLVRADLSGVGRAVALAFLRGAPGSEDVYVQRVKALRPDDLVAVARKYLDVRRAVLVEMGPEAQVGRIKESDLRGRIREKQVVYEAAYRSGPRVAASGDAERQARVDAPLKRIAGAKPVSAGRGRVVRSILPGGARLLASEDHSAPLVTVAVCLLGGVRYENDNTNGITSLVRETLLNSNDPQGRGLTYRQTFSQMGKMVSYQDKDMWGCSVMVPSDSWQDALARMGSMFSHPDLDTVNVDATRIYVLEALDKWLHDDQAQRERLIFPTMYLVSGYRLPSLGSHRTLVSIPHTEIQGWYRKLVVQPNMVVCVFGDVDPSAVQPAVERAFKDLSTKPFQPGSVAKEGEFEGFREKWELGSGPNSTVSIAFSGPPARSPDIPALYVFASLLSGPKGWFEQFIMSTGGAKGANAILSQAMDDSPLIMTLTVGGPLQEEDMVRLAFRQVKKAALLPLKGDLAPDFLNAKTLASGRYLMGLDSDPTRALQFARSELFGMGIDYPILLPARIDGITPDDMLRIGLKYFQKNQWERAAYAVCETRPGGW
jgi:zinc protease